MMKKAIAVIAVLLLFLLKIHCYVYASDDNYAEILIEGTTGQVLYEKNSDKKLHIGTLNKLMTVLIVAEKVDNGELSLNDRITAGQNAFREKGAVIWLETGEQMLLSDLLKGIIIGNANDACVAVAEKISGSEKDFVALMNTRAKELGMYNTVFSDCKGTGEGEQYSTAGDIAILTKELLSHEFLIPYMTTYMDELRDGKTQLVNTNTLVRKYKGVLGVKSAYSEQTGYCLSAAAKREDSTFVAVVIGCNEKDDCISSGKALLDRGFSSYETIRPIVPTELMVGVKVKGGTGKSVLIKPEKLSETIIPIGKSEDVTYKLEIPEYIEAPINKNQKIGELIYYLGDDEIYRTAIVASDSVEEMTFSNALLILFKSCISF